MENNEQINQIFKLKDQNGIEQIIELKMYGTIEEPLFRAKDVADIFGTKKIRNVLEKYPSNQAFVGALHQGPNSSQYFLTERGIYRYMYQTQSPIGNAFQEFVYQLLHRLRTGKLHLIQTQKEELEIQMQQQLLLTNQEIQERQTVIEEQKQEIQHKNQEIQQKTEEIIQKDLDFGVLDGEYDILHESASQVYQKERTKIPKNKAKDEFLFITTMDENQEDNVEVGDIHHRVSCVQKYRRNQLWKKYYDFVIFNRQCVSAKQFWNACNEILCQRGLKTNGTCQFQLINGFTEDNFTDFLDEQMRLMKQIPE